MNNFNLNMLLLLGLAVAALVGKVVFERFATRSEERKLLETKRKPR
jgi:hypothetical protein